jgi:5'-nucleotidase
MKSCIILCNDDGIDAQPIHELAKWLASMGEEVVIVAPKENMSACGMSLTLREDLELKNHKEYEMPNIHAYSVDGTPVDCTIAVCGGLLQRIGINSTPKLLISGVNLGSNMSIDILHSGTVAAAREAGLYGLPSIASSLTSFESDDMPFALDATKNFINVIMKLIPETPLNFPRDIDMKTPNDALDSFFVGDSFFNLNIPPKWNGQYKSTKLGRRYYLEPLTFDGTTIQIGAKDIFNKASPKGDTEATDAGFASISLLPSHPSQHPQHPPSSVLEQHLTQDWSNM